MYRPMPRFLRRYHQVNIHARIGTVHGADVGARSGCLLLSVDRSRSSATLLAAAQRTAAGWGIAQLKSFSERGLGPVPDRGDSN